MADEITITEVAEALSRVQVNYSNLAQSWYNIFYNTTPMDVQLEFYDVDGNPHAYIIPNRAKDKTYITNGEAADPTNNVAGPIGTLYQSTTTGDVYIKMIGEGKTGWVKIISQSDLDKIIVQKSGDPNETGEVRAFGTLYIDLSTGYMYMRRQESQETHKWDRIDSYATSLLTETFTVTKPTDEFVLNGICQSKEVLSVYENGILLNPSSYTMPYNDNRTVHLDSPVVVPDSEESVEVVIRYFIDTHVAESTAQADMLKYVMEAKKYAVGDYDPTAGEDQSCKWYYLQMKDIKLDLEEQIGGIDDKYNECKDALDYYYNQYHDEFVKIKEDTVNYIDANAEQFTAGVTKVYNYSVQVAEQTNECSRLYENCKLAEKNTVSYADYVRDTVDSLATKKEVQEADEALANEIDSARRTLTDYVDENIVVVNDSIEAARTGVLTQLEAEVQQITSTYNNLYDFTTNQVNTVNSWIEVHEDLADFQNETGFIREDNFPIDVNGVYKYERNVTSASTDIEVVVEKSCSYYSVDLGEQMENAGADLEFTLNVIPGDTVNTDLVSTITNYDNIISCVRVYIKNDSAYTPVINWNTSIEWLGEEPELDAGRDYIVEFISDDMMATWKAHVLGICQPAIEVDTFSAYFNIRCTVITDNAEWATKAVSVVLNIDGTPSTLTDSYYFDTATNLITFPMEIARKYKETDISNIGVRCVGVPKFTRYYSDETAVLHEEETYTFNCTTAVTEQHTYVLTVRSAGIEEYMNNNGLTTQAVKAKFKFDWGLSTATVIEGTYYYDEADYENSGVSFTFGNEVIKDELAGEADNYLNGLKITADDGTTTYLVGSVLQLDIMMDGNSSVTADAKGATDAWTDEDTWNAEA